MAFTQLSLAALSIFAASSCVSPTERFEEFVNKVPDAAMTQTIVGCEGAVLPDISGEFYMAVEPNIAPGKFLQFIATLSVDTEARSGTFSFQPLCAREGEGSNNCGADILTPIGTPLVSANVQIDSDCRFVVPLADVMVEGKANPISGGDIEGNVAVEGTVRDTNYFCGDFTGILDAPIPDLDLEGSTFGALRIEPGTLGSDLPSPDFRCPQDPEAPETPEETSR